MRDFLISVVIPVYEEGIQISENIYKIHKVLQQNNIKHEFILIDDGSKDNTWDEIKKLSIELPKVHGLRLSRNFGKEAALCAGLQKVKGQACVIMDSDLQHPPEVIPKMIKLWQDEGYDVVEGVKLNRGKEKLINKVCAKLFYKILCSASGFNLKGASDFKLLDYKVISAWRSMKEYNTFFRGMTKWIGYKQTSIPFVVADRNKGTSKWSLFKLFKLAVTAITSFSSLPLHIIMILGVFFLIAAIILGIQTLYMKFCGNAVSGFTTVILLQLIIGSLILISLGIIGMYIARIFDEVKNRPRYLIKEDTENKSTID